ncbi:MAG: hypothetical protein K9I26_06865 [Flavobacterium sp.]|nr:hypothetical protein [Flavobacterium sp.]
MKTLKNITIATQFFKSLITKTKQTENNRINTNDSLKAFRNKPKRKSNAALTQLYSKDNEILFI